MGVSMKKNVLFSLGIGLVAVAATAGAAYAVKRNGGLKRTVDQLKDSPLFAGALDKIDNLKTRFAANDTTDYSSAA